MSALTIPIEFQLTPKSLALLEALRNIEHTLALPDLTAASAPPRIGDRYQGGIYAGLSRGENSEPDAHIILIDDVPPEELDWEDAIEWAEGLGDGARLPTRFESALLYANLHDQIKTGDWYWTSTQNSAYNAWMQDCDSGRQINSNKNSLGSAKAVRRLISLTL